MKICLLVDSLHGDAILDPEYCEHHPLGGTETAVVKLAQSLRRLGAKVGILTRPEAVASLRCDVFISVRVWDVFAQGLRPGKLNYLWCHDDTDQAVVARLSDPQLAAKVYEACDGIVAISHYQSYRWIVNLHAPPDKILICGNGVDLPRFNIDASALTRRPPHAYYASTPFRGLSVLLDLWPMVRKVIGSKSRLTICSSLKVYGQTEEKAYEALYDKARQTEGIDYLGSVSQAQLRGVAAGCRALAYPCTFPETGCITAMEAMASGCAVVSTALGALPETAWRNPLVPVGEGWSQLWLEELVRVLVDDVYYRQVAEANLHLSRLMGWDRMARNWLMRFRSDTVKQAAASAAPPVETAIV
jgi:glycosyltransferase involved in cell wall biosynthesis